MKIYKKGGSPIISQMSEEVKEIDRELEELIKRQSAKIKVIGVGNFFEFHQNTVFFCLSRLSFEILGNVIGVDYFYFIRRKAVLY